MNATGVQKRNHWPHLTGWALPQGECRSFSQRGVADTINLNSIDPKAPTGLWRTLWKKKKISRQQVYTLLVSDRSQRGWTASLKVQTGAALMIYASGVDEAEAVRENCRHLEAGGYRAAGCHRLRYAGRNARKKATRSVKKKLALMQRALEENAVIVAQMTPFFEGQEPTFH